MSKAKKGSARMFYLLGAAAILLLFVFSCGLVAILFFGSSPPILGAGGPQNGTGGASSGSTPNGGEGGPIYHNTTTGNISAEDMSLWNSIDTANVQTACLARAKEEAGSSAAMVYSCTCDESATATKKSYECDIRTADPITKYFANIDCSLAARSCSVETNYGTASVGFDELRAYYGG
ncbi:hypothetical protein L0Y65_01350 [Candidatus Micrarchaeota archaeon]|nr:hypothetical protein [Candidatus Micrarchaeota archaeon]